MIYPFHNKPLFFVDVWQDDFHNFVSFNIKENHVIIRSKDGVQNILREYYIIITNIYGWRYIEDLY